MGSRKRSDWTGSSRTGFADWGRWLELGGGAIRGLRPTSVGRGWSVVGGLRGTTGVAVMAELKFPINRRTNRSLSQKSDPFLPV